jgi:hypothetical protein
MLTSHFLNCPLLLPLLLLLLLLLLLILAGLELVVGVAGSDIGLSSGSNVRAGLVAGVLDLGTDSGVVGGGLVDLERLGARPPPNDS